MNLTSPTFYEYLYGDSTNFREEWEGLEIIGKMRYIRDTHGMRDMRDMRRYVRAIRARDTS